MMCMGTLTQLILIVGGGCYKMYYYFQTDHVMTVFGASS